MYFEVETSGDVREVYYITAANEDAAREKFERGDYGELYLTEVSARFILGIEEVQDA